MIRLIFLQCALIFPLYLSCQNNFQSIHTYFKDQFFNNTTDTSYTGPFLFPIQEKHLPVGLSDSCNPNKKLLHKKLFCEHLFEISGDQYKLNISPVFNFTYGQEINDSATNTLYQNTRGVFVEGQLLDNFAFSTSFYENQAQFAQYQNDFYNSAGEYYPLDSGFVKVNAVIPNMARTKPFKTNAYDYALATGYIVYNPIKNIEISLGNESKFLGAGHRSLFLSDNSAPAPFLQFKAKFLKNFTYSFIRMKLLDLYRLGFSASDESYYTPKLYSLNMLSYTFFDKITFSIIETGVWKSFDSTGQKILSPYFYNPLPLVGLAESDQSKKHSIFGIDLYYFMNSKNKLYGQFLFESNSFQVGWRSSRIFNQNFYFQLEYNSIESNTYFGREMDYTHYNLPIAHIRGENFDELIIRSGFGIKRFELSTQFNYYNPKSINENTSMLQIQNTILNSSATISYRFNKKTNFQVFVSGLYRQSASSENSLLIQGGIRTSLRNTYTDF